MRNYKRKTNRGEISEDVYERALQEIKNGRKVATVAKEFNIRRMTLVNRLKKVESKNTGYDNVRKAAMVFTEEMEADLAGHVKRLANMFHGLSVKKLRELAYLFAKKNDVSVPESWEKNKMAGEDWCKSFRDRQDLSIRSPEVASFNRATGFKEPVVDTFFNNLAAVMDKHNFAPCDIYNMDETGVGTVQKPKSVVAIEARSKLVASRQEREENWLLYFTLYQLQDHMCLQCLYFHESILSHIW